MAETILLVDDDVKMKSVVADVLHHVGFRMLTATNGQDALRAFEQDDIDLVLLDLKLPDLDGLELLRRFITEKPSTPVVMISGFATVDRAVMATKIGAYDFLEKPLEPQRVLVTINNALEKSRLEKSQLALVEDLMARYGVVGVSKVLRSLCTAAARIAKLDVPVLVTGENGTGKELLAALIHQISGRKPFVCVNCAAVPHELIESEFFGHRKGSFTGAVSDKLGKFQLADGGTLFLDEIGDMSLEMQAKILRALEEKEVCMIGGSETTKVDVRVIAATNRELREEIRQGRFREDVFYRLRGITLHIPALRERGEDIPPLARHFLRKYCEEHNIPTRELSETALRVLQEQEWRGNVRELRHVVETLAVFSDDECVDHLQVLSLLRSLEKPSGNRLREGSLSSFRSITDAFEKEIIVRALSEANGNISLAAEKLQVDRSTLSKKVKRYGLKD